MSYICDLFFNFSLIFIVINDINTFKQVFVFLYILLGHLQLFLDDNMDEESEYFQIAKVQPQGVA